MAVLLMLLFLGSCGQLALAANITKLPRETLEWFANPANFEQAAGDVLPPGLEAWDPLPYFSTAVPIYGAVLGCNLMHEIGHRVAVSERAPAPPPPPLVPARRRLRLSCSAPTHGRTALRAAAQPAASRRR